MSDEKVTRVHTAEFEAGAVTVAGLPSPDVGEIAFAGRSNVGKSSLMNALLDRRNLVRTSSTPGCTRQINLFRTTLDGGLDLRLVDLPGYGYAKISKTQRGSWGPMLEGYIRQRATLAAIVIVVDARRGVEEDDEQLLEFLALPRDVVAPAPIRVVVVATKLDKLALSKQKPALKVLRERAGRAVVGFSAVTGEGREELWRILRGAVTKPGQGAGAVAQTLSAK